MPSLSWRNIKQIFRPPSMRTLIRLEGFFLMAWDLLKWMIASHFLNFRPSW
jgi:hypothetical protein